VRAFMIVLYRCLILASLLVTPMALFGAAPAQFDVKKFGAIGDGKANDLPAIQKAIDAAVLKGDGAVVIIPDGRYRLDPLTQQRGHLILRNARGLTISGSADSHLICMNPNVNIFDIEGSSNLKLESLKLEHGNYLFTQGVVQNVSIADRTVEVTIDPGFDAPDSQYIAPLNFLMVFVDPATHTWQHDDSWPPQIEKREQLAHGHWLLTLSRAPDARFQSKPFVIWRNVYKGWALAMQDSRDITIENVSYYSRGGEGGFVIGHCDGDISFRHFQVTVPPGSGDRFAAAGGAMVFNNRIRLIVEDSAFDLTDDDNINMGTNSSHVLAQTDARTLTIEGGRNRADYRVGDHVQIWDWVEKKVRTEARIVSADSNGQVTTVTLDRDVKMGTMGAGPLAEFQAAQPKGDIHPARRANEYDGIDRLANLDDVGTATIRRSTFQSLRARNLLIKASNTLIENNVFHDTAMASILVGPEFYWDEAPSVSNLIIRNNRFQNVSGSNIFVASHTTEGEFHPGSAKPLPQSSDNHAITIEGNEFVNFGHFSAGIAGEQGVPILIRNVDGASVRRNIIGPPDPRSPHLPRIKVVSSSAIVQTDNTVIEPKR